MNLGYNPVNMDYARSTGEPKPASNGVSAITEAQAKALLKSIEAHERISELSDRELCQRYLSEVWVKQPWNTDAEFLVSELLDRYEKVRGITRDEESGEIVSGGESTPKQDEAAQERFLEQMREIGDRVIGTIVRWTFIGIAAMGVLAGVAWTLRHYHLLP